MKYLKTMPMPLAFAIMYIILAVITNNPFHWLSANMFTAASMVISTLKKDE